MSPVPEPMQGGRGNPGNGDDEGITPPTGLTMGPPLSSSDEETDQIDSDPNMSGYQPLPQDLDDDQDESAIDYSSLSGLMAALNTHGPNVIEAEAEEENENYNVEVNGDSTQQVGDASSQSVEYVEQSRQEESAERAGIWNSPQEDRLTLDGNKVEEIKSVMASFTLPQSAIPPWAQNISDEDWKNQIAGRKPVISPLLRKKTSNIGVLKSIVIIRLL
ncbi:male-enhanced antigen 1 isoform X2 [Palaemon carinicauda]|uniref:male-enhanced antigen 1 isoform X2 n=1 Tax=Palaemon carinicauda TaxID=392227 RepID=UPI0035B660B1